MNIGLITIHRTNNYGALMQAFATQHALKKFGNVEIIDYRNCLTEDSLSYIRFSPSFSGVKSFFKDILRVFPRIRAINAVNSFINDNFNLTVSVDSSSIDEIDLDRFDIFICGSDQIWNPQCISPDGKIDEVYFLSFSKDKHKLVSYASSAGAHKYNKLESHQVKKLLSRFEHISVRESELSIRLTEMLNKEVAHVLDPTLLLTAAEWKEHLCNAAMTSRCLPEKYILVYTVPKTNLLKDAIIRVKKKLGYKVISIDQGLYTSSSVDMQIRDATPNEFISIFERASFVITDSFHGVCFSINFNKNFMAVSPGIYSNRIDSLLKLTNLENRSVGTQNDIDTFDYDVYSLEAVKLLEGKRIESLQFLENALMNSNATK
ncbi:polysaccharide pyruvyl transferase family protein [Shewanella baltica]|uniref:polysaccharide pyruvyl transferase family protein n=1 Tax=Shewanella baltica TaxID=62322 RepID=UPI000E04FE6D|nr:polysaccharide pyruvyl transferase family protein [Shewanella baltica]SUI48650.1 polysaccharide pyruvyl transferase CsaB [Shewanella baltica]